MFILTGIANVVGLVSFFILWRDGPVIACTAAVFLSSVAVGVCATLMMVARSRTGSSPLSETASMGSSHDLVPRIRAGRGASEVHWIRP